MLSDFFRSAVRVREFHEGPAGALLEGFAQALSQARYAEITARRHLRGAEHLVYWAGRNRTPVRSLTEQSLVRFGHHLRRCRCPRYGHRDRLSVLRGARLFLRYLRDTGVIRFHAAEDAVPDPPLLIAFCHWMRQQRGTAEITLYNYALHIRPLLSRLGEEPDKLDARGLQKFVLEVSQRRGLESAKTCATGLRMFLRFLIAAGKCTAGLDAAIPALAHWRLATLPRYLEADDVERLIASCDPTSAVGLRDRAILLLLARLGLRAGDIVKLRLGDIDWDGA